MVSPTLGSDQLQAGLIAGALGLLLVALYLLLYYRALGMVAVFSLVLAAVITYATFVLLGRTIGLALTLAGVAGAIVAIGITADSFVVYFERIRDEIREGRSLRSAADTGWARARNTILAADFVSLLAAVILYLVSVGNVRGFAFVLGLTTIIDVVVAFMFTRPMVTLLSRGKWFNSGNALTGVSPKRLGVAPPPVLEHDAPPKKTAAAATSVGLTMSRVGTFTNKLYRGEVSYDIVGRTRLWYTISAIILLLAIGGLLVRGLNLGIEFRGGAEFVTPSPTCTTAQAREAASSVGATSVIAQQLGEDRIRVQTEPLTAEQSAQMVVASTCGSQAADIRCNSSAPPGAARSPEGAHRSGHLPDRGGHLPLVLLRVADGDRRHGRAVARRRHHHRHLCAGRIRSHTGDGDRHSDNPGLFALRHRGRVRQGQGEHQEDPWSEPHDLQRAANLALNQTLVRSINTSIVALLPVAAILFVGVGFLGAGTLKDLALALFIGLIAGTYSSLFVATPLLCQLKERQPEFKALHQRVMSKRAATERRAGGAGGAGGGAVGSDSAAAPELRWALRPPELPRPEPRQRRARSAPPSGRGGRRKRRRRAAQPAETHASEQARVRFPTRPVDFPTTCWEVSWRRCCCPCMLT